MKDLLSQTLDSIIRVQREVILSIFGETRATINAVLHCAWGFDGSTGQSNYKIRFKDSDKSDSSLFATTIIPLRLVSESLDVLWNNPTPQSTRFCRPFKLEFVQETSSHILKERNEVEAQISCLENSNIEIEDNKSLNVKYSVNMTMIDGKGFK